MKIKNYIGLSFQDAVQNAKAELGEEVAILESQKIGSSNLLPGVKNLIQISVVDDSEGPKNQTASLRANLKDQSQAEQLSLRESKTRSKEDRDVRQNNTYNFLADEAKFLTDELSRLNEYIKKCYFPKYPQVYIAAYERLEQIGVANKEGRELIQKTYTKLNSYGQIGMHRILQEIRRHVLPLFNPYHITLGNLNKPKPIALVGPSGCGKTRTMMKLATHPEFFGQKKKRIISTDNYGMATENILNKFSSLTGIKVDFINENGRLLSALGKYTREEVLLFDTPAMHASRRAVKQLYQTLGQIESLETFLVIDATRDVKDAEYLYRHYSMLDINGIIITKLDETPRIGKIISVINRIQLPIVAICEGQSVPDHIRKDFKEVIWQRIESGIKGAH